VATDLTVVLREFMISRSWRKVRKNSSPCATVAAIRRLWSPWTAAFVQRLRELGWIEGRTIVIEYRWSEGRPARHAEIAAEFVGLKVDDHNNCTQFEGHWPLLSNGDRRPQRRWCATAAAVNARTFNPQAAGSNPAPA
jgi:hypothetical protein